MKRVLRYLKGTVHHSICYDRRLYKPHEPSTLVPTGYCDSDWAGDKTERKSVSAYVFTFLGGPVAWTAMSQNCIVQSTCEAELHAINEATKQAVYMSKLFKPLHMPTLPVAIYSDNQSALAIVESGRSDFHGRNKHFDIKLKYAAECVKAGITTVDYVSSTNMPADLLTKTLGPVRHNQLLALLNLRPHTVVS